MDFKLTNEQEMWKQAVHEFCAAEVQPKASEMDANASFNHQAVKKMGPLGLLGLNIAEEYGGTGIDSISAAIAIEELGWSCGGTALSVSAHNGLGCAPISLFGSEEQKKHWLPALASGEAGLAALALTEPSGGSDLSRAVQTHAELDGDEWVINGSKAWITNPSVGSLVVTLCRTDSREDSKAFSLIIVPTDTKGLHIHPAESKMGVRASPTHALSYENVRVPAKHLLGEIGQGLYQTYEALDGGRISIGALAIGLARAALEEAMRYAKQREAFNAKLSGHQAIQWMIADGVTQIEAARWLIFHAAWKKDQGGRFTKEASMAKLFASEMAEKVCRNAIQILGSYGYSQEYPVERFYRDARLMTIGEGTSEVQRMVISKHALG
ncbi:MAG: acyl-CoA dehydrogenase family protein [Chloroflexi bacterium]|nr:acyl-CoA dehydrogenase family protein [Chloroflexota bacterium]